jgi:hypothetical protein
MIAEECRTLRHQLEGVDRAEDRRRTVENLNVRYDDLEKLRETVLSATTALRAIAARTAIKGTIDGTKAQSRLKSIRQALQDDPQSITKGRDFSLMKSALEKFAASVVKATEETWDQYVVNARPAIDVNRVKEAELQDAFKHTVRKLESSTKEADQKSRRPPANEEQFAALEATWEEIRDLIDELPSAANDPVVREFLKAANSKEGADLNQLTDAVRDWLSENQTSDRYRIIYRNFGV